MSRHISSQPSTGAQRVARAINNPNERRPACVRSLYFMEVPPDVLNGQLRHAVGEHHADEGLHLSVRRDSDSRRTQQRQPGGR